MNNDLIIEARNFKGMITDRDKKYELLRISFKLEKVGNNLKITYSVDGKYGSGLFAPYESGYKDLSTSSYENNFKRFVNMELKTKINEIITQQK